MTTPQTEKTTNNENDSEKKMRQIGRDDREVPQLQSR